MPGDIVDAATRSRIMSGIKGKNTKPELVIRRGLHALGFRYRLHDYRLPGKPDLVLLRWRAVIQIHGCFWHGHACPLFRWPQTRQEFWRAKIGRNVERDREVDVALDRAGWRVLTVWECALKGPGRIGAEAAVTRVAEWLRSDESTGEVRGTDGASR
nr:very short patch repair endonuclease [Erythrobacter sp.]